MAEPEQKLTHEGAFMLALVSIVDEDLTLQEKAHGLFFGRADPDAATPYLIWRISGVLRNRTLGGEANRLIAFWIKAVWADAEGQNYAHGDALCLRLKYLLDGGQKDEGGQLAMKRVCAAFNAQLEPLSYYLMGCAEQTPLPLSDAPVGESQSDTRFSMGYVFHAHIRTK